ncbi:AAA family ATPase [Clavibacter michiganensis subsp. phaseoli]|uniref:AAA family ATPase n=1 Tax=Clavibacter phaseoli TaxID=1734031 RepID=UPI001FB4C92F|nr:AAA family ATPase [Clavibacter phaseoli]MCJ1710362.1 AAA family ATPase [Clavibacter phaseoli]
MSYAESFDGRIREAAYAAVDRGIAVTRLAPQGKTPVIPGWPDNAATTRKQVDKMFDGHPGSNLGAVTGAISGVVVLDVDVKDGKRGAESFAALVEEYGLDVDRIPQTFTPSGGIHYYFRWPKDGEDIPRSSKTTAGDHIDVQADRRMVVLAPSRLENGDYVADESVRGKPPRLPKGLAKRLAGDAKTADSPAREVEPLALTSGERERLAAYEAKTLTAITTELDALSALVPGELDERGRGWEEATFQIACNLLELANASWTELDHDSAFELLTEHAPKDTLWTQVQVKEKFRSATQTVGDNARAMPANPHAGVLLPDATWPEADETLAGPDEAEPQDEPAQDAFAHLAPDAAAEARRLVARRDAAEALRALEAAGRPRLADRVMTRSQLAEQPAAEPLVEGVLNADTLVMLYGPSGSGKSAVALALSASVAAGTRWLGHDVPTAGSVLYIAAEGAAGMSKRLTAWEAAWHDKQPLEDDRFGILGEAVDLSNPSMVDEVVGIVRDRQPALIVFDTLNALAYGLEENSASAMGQMIGAIRSISAASPGSTAMILHHSGLNGKLRGSSALFAAMDTVIALEPAGTGFALRIEKDRDGASRGLGSFRLVEKLDSVIVEVTVANGYGTPLDAKNDEKALAVMRSTFSETGATQAMWVGVLTDGDMSRSSAYAATNALVRKHLVVQDGARFFPAPDSPFGHPALPGPTKKKTKGTK